MNGRSKPKPNNFEHYDSRMKANAQQNFDKYNHLGRDAMTSGDRIAAESYYQHAEHYLRILNDIRAQAAKQAAAYQRPVLEESLTITVQEEDTEPTIIKERSIPQPEAVACAAASSDSIVIENIDLEEHQDAKKEITKPQRKAPTRTGPKTPRPRKTEEN